MGVIFLAAIKVDRTSTKINRLDLKSTRNWTAIDFAWARCCKGTDKMLCALIKPDPGSESRMTVVLNESAVTAYSYRMRTFGSFNEARAWIGKRMIAEKL